MQFHRLIFSLFKLFCEYNGFFNTLQKKGLLNINYHTEKNSLCVRGIIYSFIFALIQNSAVMHVGQKIKKLRELKNFTQEYMANRLEMTQPSYSKIET
ncbi:helix-turn-helix transcriptional regulator, partial [Fluviicola sp.]|uniref:helix-turn-helix domain-containing protein n=1 Tax=Fluviicola sp. TaxID=1917219 RepID=UPI00283A9FEC